MSSLPHPKPPLFSIPILRRLSPGFRKPLLTFLTLITYIPILAFSQTHIATLMTVTGASMYPLLNTDHNRTTRRDVVFVDLRNPGENLKRGMIVAFWSPNSPEKLAIKRIIALSGDTITTKPPYPFSNETIPPGHIWVEGEHPESDRWSRDSNYYGPVSFHLPSFLIDLLSPLMKLPFPMDRYPRVYSSAKYAGWYFLSGELDGLDGRTGVGIKE